MAAEQLAKGCFRALADDRSDEYFVGVDHHAALAITKVSRRFQRNRLLEEKEFRFRGYL